MARQMLCLLPIGRPPAMTPIEWVFSLLRNPVLMILFVLSRGGARIRLGILARERRRLEINPCPPASGWSMPTTGRWVGSGAGGGRV